MNCERLKKGSVVFLIVIAACSREAPAPAEVQPPPTTTTAAAAPMATVTYDDAVTWFRSTPGFHFAVEEGGVRAEGDMSRERVGVETVSVIVDGARWSAATGAQGVSWQRDVRAAAAPEWGNRLFQRVTVAFDPQKQEGQAQLVEPRHYRFTDANSGQVHDVWTNEAGQITRMTIGSGFSMTLTKQR
jgi:hypothetical protein